MLSIMNLPAFDFFRKIVLTPSPSGFETEAQRVFTEAVKPYLDDIRSDINGNVIGFKKGRSDLNVMLIAHIDEVGLIVNYIDENGFISFKPIGGIDTGVLPGERVLISNPNGSHTGVIARKTVNFFKPDETGSKVMAEDLWIDIGAKTRQEACEKISVGDSISFEPHFTLLNDDLVLSNGSDDKSGIFVIYELAKRLSGSSVYPNLHLVSSVQEEIGLRGAKTSAFSIQPDICIAIDVVQASDYPNMDKRQFGDIKLGHGVVLSKGANISFPLYKKIQELAEKNNIDYQTEAIPGSSRTDIAEVQISRNGVATALMGIPIRYLHTANEIVSRKDIFCAVDLLYEFVSSMNQDDILVRLLNQK